MTVGIKLRTYARLGPSNLARVAMYRLGLKSGGHPVQRLTAPVAHPPFFRTSERRGDLPAQNTAWEDTLWYFGWHRDPMPDGPPDWFGNPFADAAQPDATRDWWRISDFGNGDIKGLWELSRFDWAVAWATKAAHGDRVALERLNAWVADWAQANPPYKGPNWKCGQETSIRVMHLILAAWVLGQDRAPEGGLVTLIAAHLQRIAPTMSYAIGQQNNHGTSEAAALFIGGSFLVGHDPRAEVWTNTGRRWLEDRARMLIAPDGSFSQYSVTYHRVMLDTYSLAEAWRRHCGLPEFSDRLGVQLKAATGWLRAFTDAETGDAPNIGANDGARLLQLVQSDYRDFRPSVQLACAVFEGGDAFGPGPWTSALRWLEIPYGTAMAAPSSQSHDDGGTHVLRAGGAMAVLRYPRFRFRPSQADALHVDLWDKGTNLLRDGGSYSYNAEGGDWFDGTTAHNTISFDGRDQMPRLGRFLFGDWLTSHGVQMVSQSGETVTASAAYTDRTGAQHHRALTLSPKGLTCKDVIKGTFQLACLRWRLAPGPWEPDSEALRGHGCTITIDIDGAPVLPTLGTTPESRYYQHQTDVPLLSVTVDRPCTLVTKVVF